MTITRILISVLLVLSLSLGLIGCSENNDSSLASNLGGLLGDEDTSIAGKYILHTLIDNKSNSYTPEEIGYINEISIYLYEDGTAVLTGKGPTTDMIYANGKIWSVDEPENKRDFSVNGNSVTIAVEDGTLIFTRQ